MINELTNKMQSHKMFRRDYTERQVKTLYIVNAIVLIYSFISNIYLGKAFLNNFTHIRMKYDFLIGISIISVFMLAFGFYKKFKNIEKQDLYYSCVCLITALMYILWAFQAMYLSVIEGKETNYIAVLIVYAICTTLIYFAPINYIFLFITCCVGAYIVIHNYMNSQYDLGILLYVIIFGAILTAIGASRYYISRESFFARKKNREMAEDLEAHNEELIAANENLIATTDKLNALLEEQEKNNEQQRRFTAMLNHELRNPLNAIMGYLQLQLMNEEIPPVFKEGIRNSYASTEAMLQIVNDILDFSKMQEGKFEIIRSEFCLNDVINNIHSLFDNQAKEKGLSLEYNIPEEEYHLVTDGIRVQQIISNLLSNAIKYTREGKVLINVSLKNDFLKFSIADTGKGMSDEELAIIYEPYKRFDMENNKHIQGTGLGMSIVKSLVSSLNGVIKADSVLGSGTTFEVSIPVTVIKNKVIKEKEEISADNYDFTGKTFLLVDDDATSLKLNNIFLRKNNAKTILTKDGAEAFKIINSKRVKIDVLITDNLMPELTGLELKTKLNRFDYDIPSIILTGSTSTDEIAEFKEAGFDAIIQKPVIYQPLINEVAKVLEKVK